MISAFPLSQPNMLGFTLDGQIDDEGLHRLFTAMEAKVLAHGRIRLLGNIKAVGGMSSFKTFTDAIRKKADLWTKIEKYAILTDNSLISSLGSGVDFFNTRMDVKTFALSEGERAHEWLKEDPYREPADNVHLVDLGNDRLLGLAVTGALQPEDLERVNMAVEDQVRKYARARILLEIVSFEGASAKTIWDDLRGGIRLYGSLERVAIVGDQSWLKTGIKLSDLLTPGVDLAAFSTTERQRAINWLD